MKDKDEVKEQFAQKMGFNHCDTNEDLNLNDKNKSIEISCQNSYNDNYDCYIRLNYDKRNIIKYECEKGKKIE